MPCAIRWNQRGRDHLARVSVDARDENVLAFGRGNPQVLARIMLEQHPNPAGLEAHKRFAGGIGLRIKQSLVDDPAANRS